MVDEDRTPYEEAVSDFEADFDRLVTTTDLNKLRIGG